jgi:catechol 2,3-dioxygenase-like lactoylglutathione lyase family enzyme
MAVRLEHANLIVRDINGMIRFLQTAFPEFKVRGEGKSRDGSRWVHVGTDETYIALSPAKEEPEKHWIPYQGQPGVNHLAYEVDDVEALCKRMKSAGYKGSTPPDATSLSQAPILLRHGRQRLGIRAVPLRKSH